MELPGQSRLTKAQLIDQFFLDNRTRILEIAAFLDRLERAGGGDDDFRMQAFREALLILNESAGGRIQRVQMLFSDTAVRFLDELDQKSACGAPRRVAR